MNSVEEIAKKRRRVSGYDNAKESWEQIRKTGGNELYEQLNDPTAVTIIPYMGTIDPGKRPGKAFCFVGSEAVGELVAKFLALSPGQELLVIGPKGAGKSCLSRAFADALFAVGPSNLLIVCIWNMEKAREPLKLVEWLLDGLYFAYIGRRSADDPLLQAISAMKQEVEDDEDSPENIRAWKRRVKRFLRERKDAGDDLAFIVDGAQVLDTYPHSGRKKHGAEQLESTRLTLSSIVSSYKVVWGLSPRAEQAADTNLVADDKPRFYVKGFTEEQRKVFLLHSVLGAVIGDDAQRTRDMDMYAGFHPLSLDQLDEACMTVAGMKQRGVKQGVKQKRAVVTERGLKLVGSELGTRDACELLEDEEDWKDVVQTFITGETMSSIRGSVQKLVDGLQERPQFTKVEMIKLDPRFSLSAHEFCSAFVEQIYFEEFRNARWSEHGAWVEYAKQVLARPSINWSECGWLCEHICDDEISKKGMRIQDDFVINELSPQPFSSIPSKLPSDLRPGYGIMYIPVQFNYGRVDGVIYYKDTSGDTGGNLHLVGLQFTTNVQKHLHSEDEFMAACYLEKWIPDVVELVDEGKLTLDFVFVCTTQAATHGAKEGTCRKLRNGAAVGTLKHSLHIVGFDYALQGRSNPEVIDVLRRMSESRESVFHSHPAAESPSPVPEPDQQVLKLSLAQAKKLTRPELNAYGVHAKLDVKAIRKKEDLLNQLIQMNIIQIR